MKLDREQKKRLLIALLAAFAALFLYRIFTAEEPKTAPLVYTRGAVAASSVRGGASSAAAGTEPLAIFIQRKGEQYPGVVRDIFKMTDRVPKRPESVKITEPIGPPPPPTPPVPEKSPEEIAAELARADLSKFRFLGYLTDKDSSIFLSKDGENYIVKSGDAILKNYQVKEAGKDYVILFDTITRVEVRIELTGGAEQGPQAPQAPPHPPQRFR